MTATQHHADATGNALMRAILANPFDLRPRLVYADWLDENNRDEECQTCADGRVSNRYAERAEFIRLMIDNPDFADSANNERLSALSLRHDASWFGLPTWWAVGSMEGVPGPAAVLRNGFVEEIRCPLVWWVGGVCDDCQGHAEDGSPDGNCRACNNTGRTPAHGPEVVSRHPVTKVTITDREPWDFGDGEFGWHSEGGSALTNTSSLPPGVCRAMGGIVFARRYTTYEAAVEALSRVLVDWAREKAGLPAIQWEVTK